MEPLKIPYPKRTSDRENIKYYGTSKEHLIKWIEPYIQVGDKMIPSKEYEDALFEVVTYVSNSPFLKKNEA